jgi:hypothetical protein
VTSAGLGAGTWLAHCTVTLPGQRINGAVSSNTVIVCVQRAKLLHSSIALYVRITINLLIHVRFKITSLTNVTVAIPLQLSDAMTRLVFGAGTRLAH